MENKNFKIISGGIASGKALVYSSNYDTLHCKEDNVEKEIGNKTPGEFVRSIIGLDINAAKKAFSKYLDTVPLNKQQIYFINEIIEYIVKNGTLTDMHVLQESPFTNQGSISELFESDITIWLKEFRN